MPGALADGEGRPRGDRVNPGGNEVPPRRWRSRAPCSNRPTEPETRCLTRPRGAPLEARRRNSFSSPPSTLPHEYAGASVRSMAMPFAAIFGSSWNPTSVIERARCGATSQGMLEAFGIVASPRRAGAGQWTPGSLARSNESIWGDRFLAEWRDQARFGVGNTRRPAHGSSAGTASRSACWMGRSVSRSSKWRKRIRRTSRTVNGCDWHTLWLAGTMYSDVAPSILALA